MAEVYRRRYCPVCRAQLDVEYAKKIAKKLRQNGMRGQMPKRSYICKKHGCIAKPQVIREEVA